MIAHEVGKQGLSGSVEGRRGAAGVQEPVREFCVRGITTELVNRFLTGPMTGEVINAAWHFCIGWDVRILHDWRRINGEGARDTSSAAVSQSRQNVGTY